MFLLIMGIVSSFSIFVVSSWMMVMWLRLICLVKMLIRMILVVIGRVLIIVVILFVFSESVNVLGLVISSSFMKVRLVLMKVMMGG